ncbi:MAG: glycosyltransferase family 4 protein [Nibricoccus sp.]
MPTAQPNRRPRILQVVSHLALGGAERVALSITEALLQDCDFHLFAVRGIEPGGLGAELAAEVHSLNIPLHLGMRVPMRFGGVITSGIGLTRVVKRVRPDLIHLHTEIPEAAYAAMVTLTPSLRDIPVVRTIHDSVFWEFSRTLGKWCNRRLSHAQIVGVSEDATAAASQLCRESSVALESRPPLTIFNGVAAPTTTDSRQDKTAQTRPVQLVFGGRLEPQKGSDLLPAILALVRPPATGAHLAIYGTGSHEKILRRLAQHPPAGWSVELRAPVANFSRQLANFDAVLMPSRYEGLGLVAIEAAMRGVPTVATRSRGLHRAFPADYPWLATPGDAADFARLVQQALDHPEMRAQAGSTARAFAQKHFSMEAMSASYKTLYQKALLAE